jgi:hypothetical protein
MMQNINKPKKQKLSLIQKYKLYLSKGPRSEDKLSNKYNLLDDLNVKDEAMMAKLRSYVRLRS